MKTFRRPMTKVFDKKGNLKQYLISLGVKSEINEDQFHENENGKMVCDVIICMADEYDKFAREHDESESKIQSLEEELDEKKTLIERLQNQLSSIDADHEKKLKDLNDEYSGKIDKLNEDLHEKDLEIERTKTKYEKEIGEFKEEIQKEINHLDLFDDEKHMKIKDHYSEVNGIKDRIVIETINNKDNINELKESLTFLGFIMGKHKPIIKDMEEGNEHLQLIAQYSESENDGNFQDIKKREDADE